MRDATHAERGRRVAVVLVRNAVDHDSRVLREARTLVGLGFETTVLGVVSFTQAEEVTEQDGFTVRRIGPGSGLGWKVYREISRLRPSGDEAPARGPAAPTSGPTGAARGAVRRLLRWVSTLVYYARTIAALRALRPDVVHCNDYNTMWVGIAARLAYGSALVYDSHELWPDRTLRSEPRRWLVACESLFVRVADRVVTTSPGYAEELARRYRIAPPVVVRNIPERATESRRSPRGIADGARTAVYVGGLQPGRGLEQAIHAVALAPDVRLRLVGPGAPEYRAGLEELLRSLSLADRVELAEPVPPEELLDAVSGAGIGLALIEPVSLSYRLTLPNKLFEYALAGLPILGSDLPMIARFIDEHGLGATVDPSDPQAIATAMGELLDPARNAVHRRAARAAAATLDWAREGEILANVYRQALANRRGDGGDGS